jgi:hypothetical protein
MDSPQISCRSTASDHPACAPFLSALSSDILCSCRHRNISITHELRVKILVPCRAEINFLTFKQHWEKDIYFRQYICQMQSYSKIKNKGYNYGMYLDTSLIDGGTYDIDVITTKNNQYYSSGVKTQLELEE